MAKKTAKKSTKKTTPNKGASVLVRKLSVKTVYGKVSRALTESVHVMRAYGVATGTMAGETDNGEWTALLGKFKAINPKTGVESMSTKLFMPDVAQEIIVATLQNGAEAVEFALDIYADPDESSTTGYTYSAVPLTEDGADDALDRLAGALPALTQ